MCLSRPARLFHVAGERGLARLAPLPGEYERDIELDVRLVPNATVGDWVLTHAGLALESIDAEDAAALLELLALVAGPPENSGAEPTPIGAGG